MRLSYSVLLALAIVCLVSLEGVSAGNGRRLKNIWNKGKKHGSGVKILHKIVVYDDWEPEDYKKPVSKVDSWDSDKYHYDGKYYYYLYKDDLGKYFFKDSTKCYIVLYKEDWIVPSKKHHKHEPKVIIKDDEDDEDDEDDDDKDDKKYYYKDYDYDKKDDDDDHDHDDDDDKDDKKYYYKDYEHDKKDDDEDDEDDKDDKKYYYKDYDDDDKKDDDKDDKHDYGDLTVEANSDATADAFASDGGSAVADTFTSSDVNVDDDDISASSEASGHAAATGHGHVSASSSASSEASISLG